jgi:hypothetical protein
VARLRRIAIYTGGAVALWFGALAICDAGFEARVRSRFGARVAESLHADATIERGDLALVRGGLVLEGLAVKRDDEVGHLTIQLARFDCALWPLGGALFDRSCTDLALRGVRIEASSRAMFQLPRVERAPSHVGRLVIDDARLVLPASGLAPDAGRAVLSIEHAEVGETTFKSGLSWLFALRTLRATVELPGGGTLRLAYAGGELQVSGGMFGAQPIALAVALPVADPADDGHAELQRLVAFGKDVAERLLARKASAWLRSKLSPP